MFSSHNNSAVPMKIAQLRKLGLVLVFGCLFLQTDLLWGDTPANVERDINSTLSLREAGQKGITPTEKISLWVLGIGGVCLGLSICFSPKRAPQTKEPAAPVTTSCPLPQQVPRSWSEDIVPLKLKRSQEPSELASRGASPGP